MPFKDEADRRRYQRDYQRRWHRDRKRNFFEGRCCCMCGSKKDLVLAANSSGGLRQLAGGINPWSLGHGKFTKLINKYAVVRCASCQSKHTGGLRKDRRDKRRRTSATGYAK